MDAASRPFVVAVAGSPRRGNTATRADGALLAEARRLGGELAAALGLSRA